MAGVRAATVTHPPRTNANTFGHALTTASVDGNDFQLGKPLVWVTDIQVDVIVE